MVVKLVNIVLASSHNYGILIIQQRNGVDEIKAMIIATVLIIAAINFSAPLERASTDILDTAIEKQIGTK